VATDGGANPGNSSSETYLPWNDARERPSRFFNGFQGLGEASNNVAELYAMLMLQNLRKWIASNPLARKLSSSTRT
jgi:hypothetical protein